jgi:hypothetical protein
MGAHGEDGVVSASRTELDTRYPKAFRIECPCCKGRKNLHVQSTHYIENSILQHTTNTIVRCSHCMGLGFVMRDYNRVALQRLARGSGPDADQGGAEGC